MVGCYADAYCYADGHTKYRPNCDADGHTKYRPNCDADGHSYPHPHSHTYAYPYNHSYPDTYSDSHSGAYGHPHTIARWVAVSALRSADSSVRADKRVLGLLIAPHP